MRSEHGGRAARVRHLRDAALARFAELYDPARGMIASVTETGTYHPTRESLKYARALLQRNDAGHATRADALIHAVLATQEREPGNPHAGNFPWMADDGYIADLNAAEFCLESLVAICMESAALLPPETVTAIHTAMHAALAEVARLDVHVSYSNIALHEIQNTILGGQVLGVPAIVERGARKLRDWAAYTAAGAPREFNSPTYQAINLAALGAVAQHADDPQTRLLAKLWEERLWLSVALRYHVRTGQVAGPHSRAYTNDVRGAGGGLKTAIWRELGDLSNDTNDDAGDDESRVTPGVRALFTHKPLPMTVIEQAADFDLITRMSENWAMGTASKEYGPQANNLTLHYARGDATDVFAGQDFGVLFTRFILNHKRLGSTFHPTDRSFSRNLVDDGQFRGFQHENVAIACYGLLPQHEPVSAAALDVFIADAEKVGRVLIGGEQVTAFPAEVPPATAVVIEDGAVRIGLRPLRYTRMGSEHAVRLEVRDGDLVLSQPLYDGPAKIFWEYRALSGPFYRGNVESGVVVHVSDRAEYPSAEAFAATLATATVEAATTDGVRSIRYACAGQDVRFAYRLYDPVATASRRPDELAITERWANGVAFESSYLQSPVAVAAHYAELPLCLEQAGGAQLGPSIGPAEVAQWLYQSPGGGVTAVRATPIGGGFTLALPFGGSVQAYHVGLLRVRLSSNAERIEIDNIGGSASLGLYNWPVTPSVSVNGEDISGSVSEHPTTHITVSLTDDT